MKNEADYMAMLEAFQTGRITVAEWTDFCNEFLTQVLEQNRDVFIRLKHR